VPDRVARFGDVGAGIDAVAHSLEPLSSELVARHEADGLGDAPWPPNYAKQPGEPPRVQPSKQRKVADASAADPAIPSPTGAAARAPLVVVSQAATKPEVEDGLERWRARHPVAAGHLAVDDVLYDAMRGRSTVWWRVRKPSPRPPDDRPEPGAARSGIRPLAGTAESGGQPR
jgi:hypothetical protein